MKFDNGVLSPVLFLPRSVIISTLAISQTFVLVDDLFQTITDNFPVLGNFSGDPVRELPFAGIKFEE